MQISRIPFQRVAIISIFSDWLIWWEWLKLSRYQSGSGYELLRFPVVPKNLWKLKFSLNQQRALCCWSKRMRTLARPDYSWSFVWKTSLKSIVALVIQNWIPFDSEGLGESRTETRQVLSMLSSLVPELSFLPTPYRGWTQSMVTCMRMFRTNQSKIIKNY